MDAIAAQLARFLVQRLQIIPASSRLLVGVSGIPASGKSTLAELVVDRINSMIGGEGSEETAVLVGLDGWHLTRAQLDAFPDPKVAHDRRGAHWTFDGDAYVDFVKSLRQPLSGSSVITAPSFDHAMKDPTPHAVSIRSCDRIVVIEGLYTFLSIEPWRHAGELFDERWFVDISVEEATRRLVKRHVISGVAKDMDEATWRAGNNDMPNGQFIIDNILEPTRRIVSVDDPVFDIQ